MENVGTTYPQLMLRKVPLWPRERTDWAMEPAPNSISMKVPGKKLQDKEGIFTVNY